MRSHLHEKESSTAGPRDSSSPRDNRSLGPFAGIWKTMARFGRLWMESGPEVVCRTAGSGFCWEGSRMNVLVEYQDSKELKAIYPWGIQRGGKWYCYVRIGSESRQQVWTCMSTNQLGGRASPRSTHRHGHSSGDRLGLSLAHEDCEMGRAELTRK